MQHSELNINFLCFAGGILIAGVTLGAEIVDCPAVSVKQKELGSVVLSDDDMKNTFPKLPIVKAGDFVFSVLSLYHEATLN